MLISNFTFRLVMDCDHPKEKDLSNTFQSTLG